MGLISPMDVDSTKTVLLVRRPSGGLEAQFLVDKDEARRFWTTASFIFFIVFLILVLIILLLYLMLLNAAHSEHSDAH